MTRSITLRVIHSSSPNLGSRQVRLGCGQVRVLHRLGCGQVRVLHRLGMGFASMIIAYCVGFASMNTALRTYVEGRAMNSRRAQRSASIVLITS